MSSKWNQKWFKEEGQTSFKQNKRYSREIFMQSTQIYIIKRIYA